MTSRLAKKVEEAIRLLRLSAEAYDDIELCYSGGKDSDVITQKE